MYIWDVILYTWDVILYIFWLILNNLIFIIISYYCYHCVCIDIHFLFNLHFFMARQSDKFYQPYHLIIILITDTLIIFNWFRTIKKIIQTLSPPLPPCVFKNVTFFGFVLYMLSKFVNYILIEIHGYFKKTILLK